MNVNGINSAYTFLNLPKWKNRLVQCGLNLFKGESGQMTVSNPNKIKFVEWAGKNLSSPENRLILGVSALLTQPFIDAANHKVDQETRRVSICRTVAKIIACTTTGVLIRKGCIKGIDAFTKLPHEIKPNMKFKNFRSILLPTIETTEKKLKQYKNTIGTLLALGVMTFTNFLIDAPLTKALTNVFVKATGGKDGKSK